MADQIMRYRHSQSVRHSVEAAKTGIPDQARDWDRSLSKIGVEKEDVIEFVLPVLVVIVFHSLSGANAEAAKLTISLISPSAIVGPLSVGRDPRNNRTASGQEAVHRLTFRLAAKAPSV